MSKELTITEEGLTKLIAETVSKLISEGYVLEEGMSDIKSKTNFTYKLLNGKYNNQYELWGEAAINNNKIETVNVHPEILQAFNQPDALTFFHTSFDDLMTSLLDQSKYFGTIKIWINEHAQCASEHPELFTNHFPFYDYSKGEKSTISFVEINVKHNRASVTVRKLYSGKIYVKEYRMMDDSFKSKWREVGTTLIEVE